MSGVLLVELTIIGLAAGLLGGMLGVGGGIVMIPALVLVLGENHYGPDSFHLYKLASIATSIVVSLPATVRHARARAVVYRMLPSILLLAGLGVVAGVVAASLLRGELTHVLRRFFGGFLVAVVLFNVYQARAVAHAEAAIVETCPVPQRQGLLGMLVGLPTGIIAGLLGVGGGIWAVPVQRLFLGVRLRYAIANSSFTIVVVSAVTAVTQSLAIAQKMPSLRVGDGWLLALVLAPGAVVGGWCGASLTHWLPTRWLRLAFHLLLVLTGLYLMIT